MSDEKLDEYMDWVQTGWIDDDNQRPGMNLLKVTTNAGRKKTDPRTNPSNVSIGPAKGVYCT